VISDNELIPLLTVVWHTYSTVTRVVDSCSCDTLYHSRRNVRDRE